MSGPGKDAGEIALPYPVLEERLLSPVQGRFMRPARRDLTELPALRPGSVLVFHHGSRHVAFEEAAHLTGAEDIVVDAKAVALVDVRTRQFTVHLSLPSASAADDFIVQARFHARVTDPERAAEQGPLKITGYLTSYLSKDPRLSKLGAGYPIEDIASVRDLVASRIEAYCEFNPINLSGLIVELDAAGVQTPRELRIHERVKRDERWQQEVDEIRAAAEDASIGRHRGWVEDGPDALTAVGLARGQISTAEALEHARSDEQNTQARFAETFRILQQTGVMDYLDIDPTDMVQTYLEKLTGRPVKRSQRHGLKTGDGKKRDAIGSGSDCEDDAPPDEADLNE